MNAQTGKQTIYINGRFLEQPLSGVQRYAREMLSALDQLIGDEQPQRERWRLLSTGRAREVPRLRAIEIQIVRQNGLLRGHAWEQIALARAAGDGALIGFAGSGPLVHPLQLVVIHDASVFRYPNFFSARYAFWHRFMGRALAQRARIATVSCFSQQELADVLRLSGQAIPVFPNGSDHMQRSAPTTEALDRLQLRGRRYFVMLGSLSRNKNLTLAVEALKQVPDALLVLVGNPDARVFGNVALHVSDNRVIFAGRVDDAGVAGLLQNATGLVFPSLYEGFGIPPLEAMVHGCPVIASEIPAVKEVCADAALYFDPRSPTDLAAAMRRILQERDSERAARQRRGHERAATFTWDRSARQMLDFCRKELLASPP